MTDHNLQRVLGLENLDFYVGHFTTFETATKFILASREIRLSPLATTNDPRETKERLFGTLLPNSARMDAVMALLTKAVRHNVKSFCTTRSYLDEKQRIHECYRRPRMWAQYGDNHQGVCLIFDREALAEEIRKAYPLGCHNEIDYDPPLGRGDNFRHFSPKYKEQTKEAAVTQHLQKHASRLFFEKDADWKDECEYRFLVFDFLSSEPVLVDFAGALAAVVLGLDFPKVYEPAIRRVSGSVPVVNMCWSDSNSCMFADTL